MLLGMVANSNIFASFPGNIAVTVVIGTVGCILIIGLGLLAVIICLKRHSRRSLISTKTAEQPVISSTDELCMQEHQLT